MKKILLEYLNKSVGINLFKPNKIEPAEIKCLEDDYFTVYNESTDNLHHIPYSSIVEILENPKGVTTGFLEHNSEWVFVIKLGHVLEYLPE